MKEAARVYLIGRVRNGTFESYKGKVCNSRSEAREYVERELTPRLSERDGWTAFEAHDLLSHLEPVTPD